MQADDKWAISQYILFSRFPVLTEMQTALNDHRTANCVNYFSTRSYESVEMR